MFQKTPFLSEIASEAPLSRGTLAYIGQRAKNAYYDSVIRKFKESGISKAELAKRLGKDPARVNRLLSSPGNWTIETVAELLVGICREELLPSAKPFLDRPERNHRQNNIFTTPGKLGTPHSISRGNALIAKVKVEEPEHEEA